MPIHPPLAPRDLVLVRTYGHPAIHPDGGWAVLVERAVDAEANRNVTRLVRWSLRDPARPPEPLTLGPDDEQPAFSPDGRWLAFLARRDQPHRQLYLLPLNGGEPRRLTDVDGGVRELRWLPDSTGLVLVCALEDDRILPQRPPDEESDPYARFTRDVRVIDRLLYKVDGEGFLGRRRRAVLRFDLASGSLSLLLGGPYDHRLAFVEPEGRATVVIANRGPDPDRELPVRDLWRVPHDASPPERLTDLRLGVEAAVRAPDGATYLLAVRPEDHGYGGRHLVRLTGEGRPVELTRPLPGCFGDESAGDVPLTAGEPLFIGPDGRPWGLWSQGGRVLLVRLAADDRLHPVAEGDRVVAAAAVSPAGDVVLCATDPVSPGYVSLERGGKEVARHEATPGWEDVAPALPRPERLTARAGDGPEVDVWYLPPASDAQRGPDGRVPAVLEIHGGPMSMYGYRFHMEFQVLAAAGYGVVYSNPRGSLGYGDPFCRAIEADWGNHDYHDVMAALDAVLAARREVDPSRLGVAGGSYGGFLVNWIVGHTDRFAAAVTMRSVVNRMSAMGTSDMGYLRVPQFGGRLWWEDLEPYLHQSPLMWASHIRTPLLIEHQEGDMRCPIDQAEQLYMALRVLGREVVFVRYPDESHGMSRTGKPWHRVHRLVTIRRWFDEHLAPPSGAGPKGEGA